MKLLYYSVPVYTHIFDGSSGEWESTYSVAVYVYLSCVSEIKKEKHALFCSFFAKPQKYEMHTLLPIYMHFCVHRKNIKTQFFFCSIAAAAAITRHRLFLCVFCACSMSFDSHTQLTAMHFWNMYFKTTKKRSRREHERKKNLVKYY